MIDDKPYWDGGLVSNTPLQHVLERSGPRHDMVVFQIDLFSARGDLPETLFDVGQREKEIRYSSRTRLNTDIFCEMQAMRRAIKPFAAECAGRVRRQPDWRLLDRLSCDAAITIVQLIHRRAAYWTQSNDYEFSRYTMEEHWAAGRADVEHTLNHPAWKSRTPPEEGVTVLDLTRDIEADIEGTQPMKIADVRKRAFAMPLTSPAFPPGPYRFVDREYLIIAYRTDQAALEAVIPEPLTFDEPIVKYEFIRMPDSTGFGDYTESGQVVPVKFNGKEGNYTLAMFLNDGPPIYGGRELWGFPKKYAQPTLCVDRDTLVGTLDYGRVRIATGTMGFKHKALDSSRSAPAWRSRTICSRSSRMSTAARASSSWSITGWKTSS